MEKVQEGGFIIVTSHFGIAKGYSGPPAAYILKNGIRQLCHYLNTLPFQKRNISLYAGSCKQSGNQKKVI
jgi:hypothetical protein